MSFEDRKVRESDLRRPEFRAVEDLDQLEFNSFGEIVRKDRFQNALHSLSSALYRANNVWFVETLKDDLLALIYHVNNFDYDGQDLSELFNNPKKELEEFWEGRGKHAVFNPLPVDVLLKDGSLLRGGEISMAGEAPDYRVQLQWRGVSLEPQDVQALRWHKKLPILSLVQDTSSLVAVSTRPKDVYLDMLAQREAKPLLLTPPSLLLHPERACGQ